MYVQTVTDIASVTVSQVILVDFSQKQMNTHDHDYDHGHLKTVANTCIPPVNNEGRIRPPRCDLLSASGQAQDSKVLLVEHGQVVDQ